MQQISLFKNPYLYSLVLLFAVFAGIYGCTKKSNGIDNNQIVETPYSLFFSDTAGAVYASNDGKAYKNIFQADGYPCKALCSQFNNLFIIKKKLYVSTDNGKNFSMGDSLISNYTATDCNGITVGQNQSMIINVPSWSRVYVSSTDTSSGVNYLGQALSISGGSLGSWTNFDARYDTFTGGVGDLPVNMISYTRLKCGTVCGLALDPSVLGTPYRNFYKNDTPQYKDPWEEVTAYTPGVAPTRNITGTPLPSFTTSGIKSSFFTLGHYNNRLIAIDAICNYGAYYSDDTGRTWVQYPGIPTGTSLLSICSPFDESCMIGSSSGLYVLNNNTGIFQINNNGLTAGIRINGITYKENIYKSGSLQKVIFLATNKGIYQSTDGGNNWIMTIPGNYTCIY